MICDSSCSSVIPEAAKGTWEGHFKVSVGEAFFGFSMPTSTTPEMAVGRAGVARGFVTRGLTLILVSR